MIYDRHFFTDEVYARLGYKEYSFEEQYQNFLKQLNEMELNIFLVILYLKDESLYEERLASRSKFEYQKFDIQNSINQQREYLKLADEIEKQSTNINVIRFANDNEEMFETQMKEFFEKIQKA